MSEQSREERRSFWRPPALRSSFLASVGKGMAVLMDRRGRLLSVGLALAFALPMACASAFVDGSCTDELTFCGGACVDLTSSEENCGACDRRCRTGDVCYEGECRDPSDVPATGGSGAGGSGSGGDSTGSGGGPTGCYRPYDRPEACGSCDVSCAAPTPLCAPDGNDGYTCVVGCDSAPGTTKCGGSCVDLQTNENHCGACGAVCPSGICVDGGCVGKAAGHLVAICIDYSLYQPVAAPGLLLENSVFLSTQENVRILAWAGATTSPLETNTNNMIMAAANRRGRPYELTRTTKAADVTSSLARENYDVFLVYDQTKAPAGTIDALSAAWAPTVRSFVEAGGVVIVLTGGTGEMDDMIRNFDIVDTSGFSSRTGQRLYVQAPGDALAVGVVSPFQGPLTSCTMTTSDNSTGTKVFVATDTDPTQGEGAPGVVHRIIVP